MDVSGFCFWFLDGFSQGLSFLTSDLIQIEKRKRRNNLGKTLISRHVVVSDPGIQWMVIPQLSDFGRAFSNAASHSSPRVSGDT